MVHALKQIHGLLEGNGRLLDIHPIGEPAPIYVRLDEERHLVGWIQEGSDYEKYLRADNALLEAIKLGWFRLEQQQLVTIATYITDLKTLRDHLREDWQDAWIDDFVAMQIQDRLNHLTPDKELIIEEQIWLSYYKPLA